MTTMQVGDQGQPVIILPRRSIPIWAATLDASRCALEVQPKLVTYQDEAENVLAAAFLPGLHPPIEQLGLFILRQNPLSVRRGRGGLGGRPRHRRQGPSPSTSA